MFYGIDLGAAFLWPVSRPLWWRTVLEAVVVGLIPIYGGLVLLDWGQRCFDEARAGRPMPNVDFEGHANGIRLLPHLASFTGSLVALTLAAQCCTFPFGMALSGVSLASSFYPDTQVAVSTGVLMLQYVVALPGLALHALLFELVRRHLVGERYPILTPSISLRAILRTPGTYAMVAFGLVVMSLAGFTGVLACFVGVFFTMTLVLPSQAHLIAQLDRRVRRVSAGA